jgi:hypothetical protein
MASDHETVVYFMRKAVILIESCMKKNTEEDEILPFGANMALREAMDILEEEIKRANDYEEYDPG